MFRLFFEGPLSAGALQKPLRRKMDCGKVGGGSMKKLWNTLYVLSEDAYLSLDGETVVIQRPEEADKHFPLHTLENILCFSYKGASPALM